MSVIPLTLFFSLLLTGLFIALFAFEQRRRRFASLERDSLLPLAEEGTLPAGPAAHDHRPTHDRAREHGHHHAGHDAGEGCGCRTGKRAPCPGCLNQVHRSTPPIS